MKKTFTFLILVVITLSSFAFGSQTRLSVSSYNDYSLRIVIDGKTYQFDKSRTGADFIVSDLMPGRHTVKIYKQSVRGRRNIYNNNAAQILYDGTVVLRAQYHTDISINRFGRIFTDEILMSGTYYDNTPNAYPENYPVQYNQPMTTQNFTALKNTIMKESFDESRINIANQAAASNYFSAAQVKEIMQIFSFEDSKLQIAKAFYNRTTDKENYFIVNDAFTYSSSKDDLTDYIRKQ